MSRIQKLLQKFQKKPESLRYVNIEIILLYVGCEKIQAKGSHVEFKHHKLANDIIIPIHNNDYKPFYKKQVLKQISSLTKLT